MVFDDAFGLFDPVDFLKPAVRMCTVGVTAVASAAVLAVGTLTYSNPGDACSDDPSLKRKECHDNECERLYREIDRLVNQLERRHRQIRENKGGLPFTGPDSVGGHQQKFRDRQRELRDVLNRANAKMCLNYHRDAWYWATRDAPVPGPNTATK